MLGVRVCLLASHCVPSSYRCPQAGLGTWRHAAVLSSSDVLAVPKSVPLAVAATLTSGASTALRLLSDFSTLSSGDVVVQSGGESAVGEAVVQLAAKRGVKTVTFVKVRMEAVLLVAMVSHMETLLSGRSSGKTRAGGYCSTERCLAGAFLGRSHGMPRLLMRGGALSRRVYLPATFSTLRNS